MNRKPIFDAVRAMLGRSFTRDDIATLDDAIDAAEGALPASKTQRPARAAPPGGRALGEPGMKLIQSFEGCERRMPGAKFAAYPDPGTGDRPWTIGWGATGPDIVEGLVWTQAQCDERFAQDIQRYADDVAKAIGTAPTTRNQFDAMVSFHYNTGAIRKATLTKRHNEGNFAAAANEFARWNRAGGRVMNGLVRRRAAEAKLYRTP